MSADDTIIDIPLCCDLDGTLIKTDLLFESIILLLRKKPFFLFVLPFWLLKGKWYLKDQLQICVEIDFGTLPLHEAVYEFILKERRLGRKIVLVTATHDKVARLFANSLECFDEVIASSKGINLRGVCKAELLQKRFGLQKFYYIGNAAVDLPVWRVSAGAFIASSSIGLMKKVELNSKVIQVFSDSRSLWKNMFRAIRPHQVVKNLLVFVPLIASHHFFRSVEFTKTTLAFLAFSLCAWSGYVINDLIDLTADRKHPQKRFRPFASGDLSIPTGVLLSLILLLSSFLLGATLGRTFLMVLALYFLLTFTYSYWFKKLILIDVIVLAGLYVVRVIAGHEATQIIYSPWLLAFSMFIFLSLALLKRFAELRSYSLRQDMSIEGRSYKFEDLEQVNLMGVSSAFSAVVVLALYINSNEVVQLYAKPQFLWLLCPLILFWSGRIWIIASRGAMHHDPILFAIRDKASLCVALLVLLILEWATLS